MPADLGFVAGILLAGLAVLNVLGRLVDGGPPRGAAILAELVLGLVGIAEIRSGWAYGPAAIPAAAVGIVAGTLG